MSWEEIKRQEINKQVEIINRLIQKHGSITKAAKALGMSDKTIRNHFGNIGYTFDKEIKKYYIDTNAQQEEQTSPIEPVNENKEDSKPNKIETELKHDDLEKLIELKINEMLDKKLNELNQQLPNSKFDNRIVISSRCDGKSISRSFEVYTGIRDEFIAFCKTQPYTIKELVSQALLEFIENHS